MHAASDPAETILIVDDIAQNREVAAGYLGLAGYRATPAASGRDALRAFADEPADLVLLDILMPEMDGFETCRRLRQLPGGQDTPIVFLTALSDVDAYRQAMEAGPDDFLTKPINRVELLIRVRSLLRIRRLNRELRASYDLVRAQRDALAEAQRRNEELSALLVHDLKSPLAAILMDTRFALEQPDLDDGVRDALGDSLTAAESVHRMVMNLLDISRSEDGVLAPSLGEVRPLELFERARRAMRRLADANGQAIVATSDVEGAVRADPDLLLRVIENLLDNAIRHAPSGSTVRLEARRAEDGWIELRVRDEGPGVAPPDRERIFQKYVQIDHDGAVRARTSRGLGLVFCRLAIEAHGGRIQVEDNAPKGTTFCVRLPVRS